MSTKCWNNIFNFPGIKKPVNMHPLTKTDMLYVGKRILGRQRIREMLTVLYCAAAFLFDPRPLFFSTVLLSFSTPF